MIGLQKDASLMARYLPNPKSAAFTKKLDGRFRTTGVSGSLSKHFDQSEHMKREKSMLDLFQHGDQLLFEREKRRLLDIENRMNSVAQRRALEYKAARKIQMFVIAYIQRRRQFLADVLIQYFEVLFNRQALIKATRAHSTINQFLRKVIWRRRLLRRMIAKSFWNQVSKTAVTQARDKILEEEERREKEARAAEALRLENERLALLREKARAQMASNGLGLKLPLNNKANPKVPGYLRKYGSRPGSGASNRRGFNGSSGTGMATARSANSTARSSNSRSGSAETARRKDSGIVGLRSIVFNDEWTEAAGSPTVTTSAESPALGIRPTEGGHSAVVAESNLLATAGTDLSATSVPTPTISESLRPINDYPVSFTSDSRRNSLSETGSLMLGRGSTEADAVSDIDDDNDEQMIMRRGNRQRIPLENERNERLREILRERKQIAIKASQVVRERERLSILQQEEEERMRDEQRQFRREDIIGRILRKEMSSGHLKRRRRRSSLSPSAIRKLNSASDSQIIIDTAAGGAASSLFVDMITPSRPTTAHSVEHSTQTEIKIFRQTQRHIATVKRREVVENEPESVDDANMSSPTTRPPLPRIRKTKPPPPLFESRQLKEQAYTLAEQAKLKRLELAKIAKEIMHKCKKKPIELKPVIVPGSGRNSSRTSFTQPECPLSVSSSESSGNSSSGSVLTTKKGLQRLRVLDRIQTKQPLPRIKKAINENSPTPLKSLDFAPNSEFLTLSNDQSEVRITKSANALVERVIREVLSAQNDIEPPDDSDTLEGKDKELPSLNTSEQQSSQPAEASFNFSEFIDSASIQSLTPKNRQRQRHKQHEKGEQGRRQQQHEQQKDKKQASTAIRSVLGQKLAVTKKLLEGPASSPYHPSYDKKKSDQQHLPDSNTAEASVTLAEVTQRDSLRGIDTFADISVDSIDSVVEDSLKPRAKDCNMARQSPQKHAKSKARIKKGAPKSPKSKRKNPVQELLEVIAMARSNLGIDKPSEGANSRTAAVDDDSNFPVPDSIDAESEMKTDTELLPFLLQLYELPNPGEGDAVIPIVRPCSAFSHARLPSPFTAARIRAHVSITGSAVDSSADTDGIEPVNECPEPVLVEVVVSSPTAARTHGQAHTALSAGLNRLGPPPIMSFLAPPLIIATSILPTSDSSANILLQRVPTNSSSLPDIDLIGSRAQIPARDRGTDDEPPCEHEFVRPESSHIEAEDTCEQVYRVDRLASSALRPLFPTSHDDDDDFAPPLRSSHSFDAPLTLYSRLSFRLAEACEDEEEDDDEKEDQADQKNESDETQQVTLTSGMVSDGLFYDYVPCSSDSVNDDATAAMRGSPERMKSATAITKIGTSAMTSLHAKKPPKEEDPELQKIKYDIHEKLLTLDTFI